MTGKHLAWILFAAVLIGIVFALSAIFRLIWPPLDVNHLDPEVEYEMIGRRVVQLQNLPPDVFPSAPADWPTSSCEVVGAVPPQPFEPFLDGLSPLFLACQMGRADLVAVAIKKGESPTALGAEGFTPLHMAGSAAVVKLLVKRGADVNTRNEYGSTPLHTARKIEVARALIREGAKIDATDGSGLTPLMDAVFHGHGDLFNFLLEQGADSRKKDSRGNSALALAAQGSKVAASGYVMAMSPFTEDWRPQDAKFVEQEPVKGDHVQIAKRLIELGLDVNELNRFGDTPLKGASQSRGSVEMVRLLLEHGADPNIAGMSGYSSMYRLADPEIAELLIKAGGDPNGSAATQQSPLYWAAREAPAVARVLLAHGARVKRLGTAVLVGDSKLVRQHLAAMPRGAIIGYEGIDALCLACEKNKAALVRELLKAGVPARGGAAFRDLPLHQAAAAGAVDCAAALLKAGANPLTQDEKGRTAPGHRAAGGQAGHRRAARAAAMRAMPPGELSMDDATDTPERGAHPVLHRFLKMVVVLVLLIVAWVVWYCWVTRGYRDVDGIYIADGGQAYVRISAGGYRNLFWREGHIVATIASGVPEVEGEVRLSLGKLKVIQREYFGKLKRPITAVLEMEMVPGTGGDWDLVAASHHSYTRPLVGRLGRRAVSDAVSGRGGDLAKLLKDGFRRWKGRERTEHARLPKGTPPFRSYLHRLDDKRIPEYFAARRDWTDPADCLDRIRALCADHPDDRFLMLHLVDLEAGQGDLERAREVYARWRGLYEKSAGPILSAVARRAWKAIRRTEWLRRYPDMPTCADRFPYYGGPTPRFVAGKYGQTLKERMRYLRDRSRIPEIYFTEDPIVMPTSMIDLGRGRQDVNLLQCRHDTEVSRAVALLALIEGRYDDALSVLVGAYRLATDLQAASGGWTTRSIGTTARLHILRVLAVYGLNACESAREMECFADLMDELAATPGQTRVKDEFMGESPALRAQMDWYIPLGHFEREYPPNYVIWNHRGESLTNALRGAARARLHFLRTGVFPESQDSFVSLFDGKPLLDPFLTSASLSYRRTDEGCVVYSLGPDKLDQAGLVPYDPTNGASSGDIAVHVLRTRQYPFSRDGLRAGSARDVLRVFPNGLPVDPLSPWSRGDRLSIVDSVGTYPVTILSNRDDTSYYDKADPKLWPFPIPERQPVYMRWLDDLAPDGAYFVQPSTIPRTAQTAAATSTSRFRLGDSPGRGTGDSRSFAVVVAHREGASAHCICVARMK